MTLLDYALSYAERGWPVFPVHTPTENGCSCRHADCSRVGKHPRIPTGRNGATLDPVQIKKWWEQWPEANIGIATGIDSKLIVLDVDEGGEESLEGKEIPHTIEQITGSGGRHVLFLHPMDGHKYKTRVRFMPGLDSRADGGYIVAPPSLHKSGAKYEWELSCDPEDTPLSEPPQWLLDALQAPDVPLCVMPTWDAEGDLPENIADMLAAIPADNYETWRDVGFALHHTDPLIDGMMMWDWWSSTATNYSPEAVRKEWRNFSRRQHQTANPITLCTVRRLAEEHGWIDPDLEHGAEVAAMLMESHQKKQAAILTESYQNKKEPIKEIVAPELMPKQGLIKDIATRINATSIRPQPILAVMAATAFIGTLAGRKYQTETGLRTNIYAVGLAESGAGKDQARKEINNLATASGCDELMGGDRIASGPGIITALEKSPSKLFMLDEFGIMLQSATGGKSDPHKKDMLAILMTLYSCAGSIYRGTEYADQKDRARKVIKNPNACIYGTSTHSQFYAALTSSQGVDGTLSRLIVASSDKHRPERQRPTLEPPSTELLKDIASIAEINPGGGNLSPVMGGSADRPVTTVFMDAAVYDAWEQLDDDMTSCMIDSASNSVYSRVAENAAKLALVYAISVNHFKPKIDAEAFAWGREIALWAANTLMHEVARHVADNDIERDIKKVFNVIADRGEHGITQRAILRAIRTVRAKEIKEICQRLHESGQILITERKNKGAKSSMVYVAVDI